MLVYRYQSFQRAGKGQKIIWKEIAFELTISLSFFLLQLLASLLLSPASEHQVSFFAPCLVIQSYWSHKMRCIQFLCMSWPNEIWVFCVSVFYSQISPLLSTNKFQQIQVKFENYNRRKVSIYVVEPNESYIQLSINLEVLLQVKCDQYWPGRGTETYGLIQVTLLDTVELATYTVRTFALYKVLEKGRK